MSRLEDQTIEERRAEVAAQELELAQGQLRAARRAAEEHEQTPAVQTLRALERIEALLIEIKFQADPRRSSRGPR